MKVPANFRPWTGRPDFKGFGLPKTQRVLDLLDLRTISKCRKDGISLDGDLQHAMSGHYLDISQSFNRHACANRQGVNHALTTGSAIYSFARGSMLTARELLMLHEQPLHLNTAGLAESQLTQLAGEGMALPCLAGIVWCIYLTKQFPK